MSSDDEEASPSPRKKSTSAILPSKNAAKPRKSASSKKKDEEYSVASDVDDDLVPTKAKGKRPAPKKKPPVKDKAKKEADEGEEPKKKFKHVSFSRTMTSMKPNLLLATMHIKPQKRLHPPTMVPRRCQTVLLIVSQDFLSSSPASSPAFRVTMRLV